MLILPYDMTAASTASRSKALSLYRKLLRSAMKMPTPNRQNYVIKKTREEYRANKGITDPKEIDFLIRLDKFGHCIGSSGAPYKIVSRE